MSTNISSSVVSPDDLMGQASHEPSLAPAVESQSRSVWQAAATLPATQATGVQVVGAGKRDLRVTSSTLGEPSALRPLLNVAQYSSVRLASSAPSKPSHGSKCL